MPVIAVIEEAQSVLSNTSASPEDPYVVWTKEDASMISAACW